MTRCRVVAEEEPVDAEAVETVGEAHGRFGKVSFNWALHCQRMGPCTNDGLQSPAHGEALSQRAHKSVSQMSCPASTHGGSRDAPCTAGKESGRWPWPREKKKRWRPCQRERYTPAFLILSCRKCPRPCHDVVVAFRCSAVSLSANLKITGDSHREKMYSDAIVFACHGKSKVGAAV